MSLRFGAFALLALFSSVAGCRSETESRAPGATRIVLSGGIIPGVGARDVEISGGRITRVGKSDPGARRIDVSGRFIVPAVIDSHVHLAYLPKARELAAGGVAAVVDLASPESFLAESHAPLELFASGPMITAVGGYPTQGWGHDGYGLEVATPSEATHAVDELFAAGARVIKLPVTEPPVLDDATLAAAATRAHERGLKVATHALDDAAALRAANAGADVLAHTPLEPLSEPTLAAWSHKTVITTLSAFGGQSAESNLSELRKRGARVLYGTDFGNTGVPGPSEIELSRMVAAGLDGAAVLEACTRAPAELWGFSDLGAIEPGKAASLLVLATDPLADPTALAHPLEVYVAGMRQ